MDSSAASNPVLPTTELESLALVAATSTAANSASVLQSNDKFFDMNKKTKIRVPQTLMSSYNKLMASDEGKVAMKRIKVCCGVCKATRFYSLHRGITRIAGVISCELCRHFYQGVKRKPSLVACVSEVVPGECYNTGTWLDRKCKACWILQIAENCPLSGFLYLTLSKQLPEEIQFSMRGMPQQSSRLHPSAFGSLALEIYRDSAWVDVTDTSAIDQQLELRNVDYDSDSDQDIDSPNDEEDIEMEERSDSETSESNTNTSDVAKQPSTSVPETQPALPTVKKPSSILFSSVTRKLRSSMDLDDPDDPDAVGESDSSQGNSAIGAPSPMTSSPAHSRSASPQLGGAIKTKPKAAAAKVPKRTSNRTSTATKSDSNSDNNVENNNSNGNNNNNRNSLRTRRTRKHEKIDYFNRNDSKTTSRSRVVSVYGPDGRILSNGKDLCDCLQPDCPGCHFPCPKCRSTKCGKECRVNRRWYYERVEMEGTKFFWTNAFIKSF